jgi:hypothetical protein
VALVRFDVSEELGSSFFRVTRIGELAPSSPTLVTLMKEPLSSSKRRFLQEPHRVTSQKTPFFLVTAVKTSNLTKGFQVTSMPMWVLRCYGLIISWKMQDTNFFSTVTASLSGTTRSTLPWLFGTTFSDVMCTSWDDHSFLVEFPSTGSDKFIPLSLWHDVHYAMDTVLQITQL